MMEKHARTGDKACGSWKPTVDDPRHLTAKEREAYLAGRATRGSRTEYDAILARVPDVEAEDADHF